MPSLEYGTTITPGFDYDRGAYVANVNAGYESGVAMEAATPAPVLAPAPVVVPPVAVFDEAGSRSFVENLYWTYYHRAPDALGVDWWLAELRNGIKTRAVLENAFATTPDFPPDEPEAVEGAGLFDTISAFASESPWLFWGGLVGIGAYALGVFEDKGRRR